MPSIAIRLFAPIAFLGLSGCGGAQIAQKPPQPADAGLAQTSVQALLVRTGLSVV